MLIETNQNVVLFQTIISVLLEKEGKTSFASKLIQGLSCIRQLPASKEFLDRYNNQEIPQGLLPYVRYSIYSDSQLNPDNDLNGYYSYGRQAYAYYNDIIKPLFIDIMQQSKFQAYYDKNIKPGYEILCLKYKVFFEKNDFTKEILTFWKPNFKPKLYFIPNICELAGGFGVTKSKRYFSITGLYDEGSEKGIENGWSNSIHEYCHSFFKDALVLSNTFEKHLELADKKFEKIKDQIPQKVSQVYRTGNAYFEDCLVRAAKIKILGMYYKNRMSEADILEFTKKALYRQVEEDGFEYVNVFYKGLGDRSGVDIVSIYLKILDKI